MPSQPSALRDSGLIVRRLAIAFPTVMIHGYRSPMTKCDCVGGRTMITVLSAWSLKSTVVLLSSLPSSKALDGLAAS